MSYQNNIVGYGMNKSKLSERDCLRLLLDFHVLLENLSNDDLDSLYRVANGVWAYHLTRKGYIDSLYKYRLNNSFC
jgi:hypothetical protein